MDSIIYDGLKSHPIIPAVRSEQQLKAALASKARVVFILESKIFDFEKKIQSIKDSNKSVFIHMDLIDGLNSNLAALEYVYNKAKPDGILTTKRNLIIKAKSLGLSTVQRMFLIDTTSIRSAIKMAKSTKPDAIEILPGVVPKAIKVLKRELNIPIITGGLITNQVEVNNVINSGALAASVSKSELWNISL